MSDVDNITTVASSIIKAVAQEYEMEGILPNLCMTGDSQTIMLSMGKVVKNLTLNIAVVQHTQEEYYLDLTAYFANEDYFYPEGSTKENAMYVIRAAPSERVFNNLYEVSGESLAEAFIDAFYVILDELKVIVSLILGEPVDE